MTLEWAIDMLRQLGTHNHSLRTLLNRQNKALYEAARERDELLAWKKQHQRTHS